MESHVDAVDQRPGSSGTARRPTKGGVPLRQACKIVSPHTHWRVVETDVALFRSGMEEAERWQLSHWDGLILAAARRAGVKVLLSEDFNAGQNYGGIRAVNPFA